MFGSEPFAGTITVRPTGITSGGGSPWRPMPRVQGARELARRVVADHVRASTPRRAERLGLELGVLDHGAPEGPRERHDDAHLHGAEPNGRRLIRSGAASHALGEIGVRRCGTPEAERAAHAVADAFAALGLEPRFQEFPLLGYEAEEPLLEVDGERWEAGPCMYARPGEVEGEVLRLSDGIFAVGEEGRLRRSPFGVRAIPFMAANHVTTPPTAFISPADAERLRDGMRARLVVRGRFVPGRRDRNVIAELPGESEETIVVGAHYDSVWRGPGAIDNATGVEGSCASPGGSPAGSTRARSPSSPSAPRRSGLLGSKYYVNEAKSRGEARRIAAWSTSTASAAASASSCCARRRRCSRAPRRPRAALGLYDRYGVVTELGQEAGTDHLPFAQARDSGDERAPLPLRRVPLAGGLDGSRGRAVDGRRGRPGRGDGREPARGAGPQRLMQSTARSMPYAGLYV